MNRVRAEMWSRSELEQAMVKEGWQPGTVPGRFIHGKTNKGIDIEAKDDNGRVIWLTYALLNITPSPF